MAEFLCVNHHHEKGTFIQPYARRSIAYASEHEGNPLDVLGCDDGAQLERKPRCQVCGTKPPLAAAAIITASRGQFALFGTFDAHSSQPRRRATDCFQSMNKAR